MFMFCRHKSYRFAGILGIVRFALTKAMPIVLQTPRFVYLHKFPFVSDGIEPPTYTISACCSITELRDINNDV